MLAFPPEIRVTLLEEGQGDGYPGILVSCNFFWHGRYYFGTTVGTTDGSGRTQLKRDQLELDFRENQRLFPMDLKVQLDNCDPLIEVVVRGGAEFSALRDAVERNPLVTPRARAAYAGARNAMVESASSRVVADSGLTLPVEIVLWVRQVG